MGKQKIELMIEGGKATPAPPLGPTLGQLKMNVSEVVSQINSKTQSFKGMKVPVTLIVDDKTKEFEIEIGTPPASQLIKKEFQKLLNFFQKEAEYINRMNRQSVIFGINNKTIIRYIYLG